jgi:tRNA (cmo5U34)-methyltransferase
LDTPVGDNISQSNAGWSFEGISEEFDEHVERSVPLYNAGHDLVCKLSDFFLPEDGLVVELGTSTGVLAERFLKFNEGRKKFRYLGLDVVDGMLEKARSRCAAFENASFVNEDIRIVETEPTSMFISYYTMQFIHPSYRQEVIDKIYQALEWGGAFMLFEKVRAPDARFQDIMNQLYHEFKIDNGFSEVEIMAKQRSLKGVLEPFSTQANVDMMKRAGFLDVMTIMKSVSFEGFLAIK